jgi:O-antigen ligase
MSGESAEMEFGNGIVKDGPGGSGPEDGGSFHLSWRLIGALLAAAALVTAAAIFLPTGALKLLLITFLSLPVLIYLVSKPELVLAIILTMRFTNFDIFLPMRLYRPLSLLLVLSIIASWFDGRRPVIRDKALGMLIIAFFLVAFHSIAFAGDLPPSLHALESLAGVLLVIVVMLPLVSSKERFVGLTVVLAVATLISSFLPFAVPPPGHFGSKTLMWGEGVLRYEGYQFEANIFAFHQVFIIPVLLFILARFKRPRIVRPLVLAALAGTIFVLMLSFSRGGFVGLLVIVAVLLFVERKNRTVMAVAASAAVILAVAAPALYWDRIVSLYEAAKHVSEDFAIMVRIETLRVALVMGFENLLFGVGIGNFINEAARFIPYTKVVHNAFLQIFTELGLPGLIIVSAVFVRNLKILSSMIRSGTGGERATLGRFLIVQQVAVAVNAMFIPVGYEFIFWLALVIPSLADAAYSEKTVEPERL